MLKQYDGRNRLSGFWTPTKSKTQDGASQEDSHDLLVRAGFLRQAHSGIFHLLPLGLRVQNKIEALIDKHMSSLSATKVSLSSISSEELWQRSGRLEGRDSEFLRLQDRKGARYLLSPTHEEEITEIVASSVNSYKDLPLRLYQVTRKYRDEARPRQGLLRGREFLMKDLYTFDVTEEEARVTYDQVRNAYSAFFNELGLPYLVANADSGSMGGNLSHEYHLASDNGEDNIVSCEKCDYSTNEELYPGTIGSHELVQPDASRDINTILTSTPFLSKDKTALFNIITPKNSGPLNAHLLKKLHRTIDTTLESPFKVWSSMNTKNPTRARTETQIIDGRLANLPLSNPTGPTIVHQNTALTSPSESSTCPSCLSPASLQVSTAIEIGHTFHLGTRYSLPLKAQVLSPNNKPTPISMGCHGIGVSRLLAAAAGLMMDSKGLNWPMKIAPFEAVIVAAPRTSDEDVDKVYDALAQGKFETPSGLVRVNYALTDYQMQVMLLDNQTKKRLVMAQSKQGEDTTAPSKAETSSSALESDDHESEDYDMQWMLLDEQTKNRLSQAQLEPSKAFTPGDHALEDYKMQLKLLDEQNTRRMLSARQPQGSVTSTVPPPAATPLDVAIDDRDRPLGWKLNDADLIGYPFIIVLGKAWKARGAVEVQCRRLRVKEEVLLADLVGSVKVWAAKLRER
jgi:prolyl-tRNA synthetase